MRHCANYICLGSASLALLCVSSAHADPAQTSELAFLARSCISAAAGGADIVATIEASEYSGQLQPHHRNNLERTKVFQATDRSFFLQNDPVAETCIVRSTVGTPDEM